VIYDYRDEASKKLDKDGKELPDVERHKIHYEVKPYQGRNRLYRKRDVLFPKARAGNNDVLADYVEDLQFSDPGSLSGLALPNDRSNCDTGGPSWRNTGYCKKLDKDGKLLPDKVTSWACTKDEYTGLIWEIKHDNYRNKDLLHYVAYKGENKGRYRWGGVGAQTGGKGTYYNDWNELVNGSNNENLCGRSNWRVPTLSELNTTRHLGGYTLPRINKFWFGTVGVDSWYEWWTVEHPGFDSTSGIFGGNAITQNIRSGSKQIRNSAKKHYVRLVSSEESSTRLVMIDLILRTKKEFGPARSYTKKSYAGGNYNINKNDAYKRQEYSSTVLIRNPL